MNSNNTLIPIQAQEYKIIKSNDLIQQSRFSLSLQEQKIILYLISKIKPEDMDLEEYEFQIQDFCFICGLDKNNGANYKYIKQTLKGLRDKSIWITRNDGAQVTLGWISKVVINPGSGNVLIKLDDDMKPYLVQLQKRYTSYELLYTLAMRSQYSIRIYELLKSYEYQKKKVVFDINSLKEIVNAETYTRFPDFKRKVIDIAIREINDFSDLNVSYEMIKEGRRYAKIVFDIKIKKGSSEKSETLARIDEVLNPPQLSLFPREEKML